MSTYHSLLRRQLKRHFAPEEALSPVLARFVGDVDAAYRSFDEDRSMLERSLDLSSQELFQANSEMRALFQAIPDLLFRVDANGKILSAKLGAGDDPLLRLRAAGDGHLIQDTLLQPAANDFVSALQRVISARQVQHFEFTHEQDERRSTYEVRLTPVPQREVLVIIRNITEHKHLEAQFLQSQKMEAVGQLAGGLAHDFNNLLTVIQGNLSLLRLGDLTTDEFQAAVADTLAASQKAAALTHQLLTFSRREPIELRSINLNAVVAEVTRMFQRVVGEHITIRTTFTPGALPVSADAGLIEQLLMNLVVNARDAMPKGGQLEIQTGDILLNATTVEGHPQRRLGRFAQLSVSDTGTGIPPEHLARIFEPFYTTKEAGKGTGLGLASVFGIVQQHRGWVEVESALGSGSVFRVFLPRLVASEPLHARDSNRANAIAGGNESILLVEDEALVRRMMKDLLERYGYHVVAMENAVRAYNYVQSTRPKIDLLVTDMVMPGGMNGRELIDMLRSGQPDLKAILCSGYANEFAGAALPANETIDFIAKPFEAEVLLRHVRNRLDAK